MKGVAINTTARCPSRVHARPGAFANRPWLVALEITQGGAKR
jgi:hypothetical protein